MGLSYAMAACAASQSELTLSSGVDIRHAEAVGVTCPRGDLEFRRAFVLVPTAIGEHGGPLDAGLQWRECRALDVRNADGCGFDSFELRKLVATRLAYVAADAATLTFAVRRATQ